MRLLGAAIGQWKSIWDTAIPLDGLTVLVGANGAGKTNVLEAIGLHDPQSLLSLSRVRRDQIRSGGARVGFAVQFDTDAMGGGPDAEVVRELIVAPWVIAEGPSSVHENIGAYCGDSWSSGGASLKSSSDQASLSAVYRVVKSALLAGAPDAAKGWAEEILDLLFNKPVLVIQEDFAVYLSCDREASSFQRINELSKLLCPQVAEGPLQSISGVLGYWKNRFPPLLLLGCGPSALSGEGATGFQWVLEQLGRVRVVSAHLDLVESDLQDSLEVLHDSMWHEEGAEVWCESCIRPDHGGWVDPSGYANLTRSQTLEKDAPWWHEKERWLEELPDGWVRVRPQLTAALQVLEEESNRLLPRFVLEQGRIRLTVLQPTQWVRAQARCQILFELAPSQGRIISTPSEDLKLADNPEDEEIIDTSWPNLPPVALDQKAKPVVVPLSDLGAGPARWVAIAVRLAADGARAGEINISDPEERVPLYDWEDLPMPANEPPIKSPSPRILLIDEPEQHLHPAAQPGIAKWCVEQAQTNTSVLVATHSPAFLALPSEQASLCLVARRGQTSYVQQVPAVHGRADAAARARMLGFHLGLGHDALLRLTRAILIVEGEWDRRVLHQYFSEQLAEHRVLVVPLQGADEVSSLADAAVLFTLGLQVLVMLDNVHARTPEELMEMSGHLTKEERALRDLHEQLTGGLRFIPYNEPDIICALPESAVRRVYPDANFPGWQVLLREWRDLQSDTSQRSSTRPIPFKRYALERMGLPGSVRKPPTRFFFEVLKGSRKSDAPSKSLSEAVEYLFRLLSET